MFNDNITVNINDQLDTISLVRRALRGLRQVWSVQTDTPSNERRMEIGHEVTSAKRVNSLVKFAKVRPHPVTGVLEEFSIQTKYVHPASATLVEMEELANMSISFNGDPLQRVRIFNQE